MRRAAPALAGLAVLTVSGCSLLPGSSGSAESCSMPEEDEGVIYDVAPPSLAMTLVSGSLQVSEDGTEIAGLHGNQILIWDAATGGSASASIGEPTYAFGLSSLAAAPDFAFFAVPEGGDAIAIKSRNGDSETIALEPWLEDEKVQQIEISPDGERMAVRGSTGLIAIYDLPSRDLEMTLAACADSPGELAFSPDSSQLFAASHYDETSVWDLEEQDTVFDLESEDLHYQRGAWSHDGSQLAISAKAFQLSNESNLTMVDTSNWEVSGTYEEFAPDSVAFLPDDEELLITPGGNQLTIWPIGGTERIISTNEPTGRVDLSPDGTTAYFSDTVSISSYDLETESDGVNYEVPEFDCNIIEAPDIFEECD